MNVLAYLRMLVHDDEGQDLLEYALLATLIAVICIGTVGLTGNSIHAMWGGFDGGMFEAK